MNDHTPDMRIPKPTPPSPELPNREPVEPHGTTLWLRVKHAAWKVAPWVNRVRSVLDMLRR